MQDLSSTVVWESEEVLSVEVASLPQRGLHKLYFVLLLGMGGVSLNHGFRSRACEDAGFGFTMGCTHPTCEHPFCDDLNPRCKTSMPKIRMPLSLPGDFRVSPKTDLLPKKS